jgi:hypothetical protein
LRDLFCVFRVLLYCLLIAAFFMAELAELKLTELRKLCIDSVLHMDGLKKVQLVELLTDENKAEDEEYRSCCRTECLGQ